jgi:group I intron endonuclease
MVGIYKITSPAGRIYIGQSIDIKRRWRKYQYEMNKYQYKLYNSFQKYGFNNHVFEIIEECDIELLNQSERYWQDCYDVLNGGLNCQLTKDKDRSGFFSEEHRSKISKSNKGKKRKVEFGLYLSTVLIGKKRTNETKNKISLLRNRKEHNNAIIKAKSKIVLQYDLKGNLLTEWSSGKEAARTLNINQPNINIVCMGKGKTYKGFIWKYKTI